MAADSVEMQEIRGLDIDKTVKGFALTEFVFKPLVTNAATSGDSIRWYQETSTDLTATSPSVIANIAPLSIFPTLEPTWTRNTTYVRKYAAESFMSLEDIKSADIDVLARTLLRLTRAVVKQVDTRIYNVLTSTQNLAYSGAATGTGWDDTTNGNPILDIMSGAATIAIAGYNPYAGGIIAMDPKNHKDLMNYLITVKGSSIPALSSETARNGVIMNLLGFGIIVSPNVVADSVWMGNPSRACTWKSFQDTTSRVIDEPGMGSKVRVWEIGEAILTDPQAGYLITDTNT